MTDTMSLAELIEDEKYLAAAVATATAVAKASKAAHKAAAERLARYKIGYSSIWRSFATRLQIEKQKRQKLLVNLYDIDIREDVIVEEFQDCWWRSIILTLSFLRFRTARSDVVHLQKKTFMKTLTLLKVTHGR